MYSLDLNIPVQFPNVNLKLDSFRKPTHLRPPTDHLVSADTIKFFDSLNLSVGSELFFSPPNANTTIHTDDHGGDIIKLNWIIGGRGSLMRWWKPLVDKPLAYTIHAGPTTRYDRKEVELLHSAEIKQPSMVQVGIPHSILNTGENRWCISLIPTRKENNQRLTWAEGLEIFGSYTTQA